MRNKLLALVTFFCYFLSLFLFLAAVSVVLAVRSFGRGLDADGNGVVVRNILRVISIPWRELAAIEHVPGRCCENSGHAVRAKRLAGRFHAFNPETPGSSTVKG
jgi:hypothetical protein